MSLEIIKEESPKLPFKSPLADNFRPGDELVMVACMKPNSSVFITLTSGDGEKKVLQLSVSLSITEDNKLVCKWDKTNKEEEVQVASARKFENFTFCMKLSVFMNKYRLLVDGVRPNTFLRSYSPFRSDTLEIGVSVGTALVKLVSLKRPMQWFTAKIGSLTPVFAFKCGKDEFNNDIYLGRGLINNNIMIVSVIPAKRKATTTLNGRECSIDRYELLEYHRYYGWKFIGPDKMIPKNAIARGTNKKMEMLFIGRATYEGSMIPGTIHAKSGILSIPFKGKEVQIASGYQVLVTLTPLEVVKDRPKAASKVRPPKNDCVICYAREITTAFFPCGHLGFCESCAKELMTRTNNCPICQKEIISDLRIYKV